MRFAAVVKKFTFLFRGFPRRYAPLNDMMTTVLTAMTPEYLLHAPFPKLRFFTSLLSKSLLLRQHLETLLFSRVFCYIFLDFSIFKNLFEAFLYTVCAYSKTELESQGDDRSEHRA